MSAIEPNFPFVSVVVPTRNRAALLRHCLKSLIAQDFPSDHYEIIVIDDGSRDETTVVASEFARRLIEPRVRMVSRPALGLNAARNRGIALARGELICLVDDDVDAPASWLSAMVGGVLRHPA